MIQSIRNNNRQWLPCFCPIGIKSAIFIDASCQVWCLWLSTFRGDDEFVKVYRRRDAKLTCPMPKIRIFNVSYKIFANIITDYVKILHITYQETHSRVPFIILCDIQLAELYMYHGDT